jgi:arsenite-transporting ATPase
VNLKEKIFFFSGKGGVGKTTLSSAIATTFADMGFKTLLVSLDPAHSLSLILNVKELDNIKKITSNLYALEINVDNEMKSYLKRVEKEAKRIVSPVIFEEIKKQIELAYYSPGAFELAILDIIHRVVYEFKDFEKIVFDTAPSGYTLRLVSLPSVFNDWIDGLLNLRKEVVKYEFYGNLEEKRELSEVTENDDVMKILKRRKTQFELLREIFLGEETLFGVVLTPQKLPVEIAKRTLEELESLGVKVNYLFVNKVKSEKEVKEVEENIPNRKLILIKEQEKEPIGISSLLSIGREVLRQL